MELIAYESFFRWACVLSLLTMLLPCVLSSAATAENTELETLFQNATASDGANTELYAGQLADAFCSDPVPFLEALAKEPPSTQDLVFALIQFDQGPSHSFVDLVNELPGMEMSEEAAVLARNLYETLSPQPSSPPSTETAQASIPVQTASASSPESTSSGRPSLLKMGLVILGLVLILTLGFCLVCRNRAYRISVLIFGTVILLLWILVLIFL